VGRFTFKNHTHRSQKWVDEAPPLRKNYSALHAKHFGHGIRNKEEEAHSSMNGRAAPQNVL